MAITPNSTIQLFSGIPLDSRYNNVVDFANINVRDAYFNALTPVATYEKTSYQRVNSNACKVQYPADALADVNYMRFQNTNYTNRWFYAFVNSIDYINDVTCQINYQIDIFTSYWNYVYREQCFVERCHPARDDIGDNLLPEPVALGEYVIDHYHNIGYRDDEYSIKDLALIIAIVDNNSEELHGQILDGIYSGAHLFVYRLSGGTGTPEGTATLINAKLSEYISNPNAVVNMYVIPYMLIRNKYDVDTHEILPGASCNTAIWGTQIRATTYTDFDGYTPRNKKLYTYPYQYLHMDNGDGSQLATRFEFFQDGLPRFRIDGTMHFPVQLRATPYLYKINVRSTDDEDLNHSESLCIGNYPAVSWSNDSYSAWCAQNSIPTILQVGAGVAVAALGIATGGIGLVAGVAGGVTTAASVASQYYKASKEADICQGNISAGNVNIAKRYADFYVGRARITGQYAQMIDKFFDMYGYAFNKIALPPVATRPYWNYVKTTNCELRGYCPQEAIKTMCEAFDRGITFWHSMDYIGNYSYNNSPA